MGSAFARGFVVYPTLELLWRGRTHWTMALAGGLGFAWLKHVGRAYRGEPLVKQAIRGGLGIMTIEYLIGRRFNRRYHIWDYRKMPLNVQGQICLPFAAAWCALSAVMLAGRRKPFRGIRTYFQ